MKGFPVRPVPVENVGVAAKAVARRQAEQLTLVRRRAQPSAVYIARLTVTAVFAYLLALQLPGGIAALRAGPADRAAGGAGHLVPYHRHRHPAGRGGHGRRARRGRGRRLRAVQLVGARPARRGHDGARHRAAAARGDPRGADQRHADLLGRLACGREQPDHRDAGRRGRRAGGRADVRPAPGAVGQGGGRRAEPPDGRPARADGRGPGRDAGSAARGGMAGPDPGAARRDRAGRRRAGPGRGERPAEPQRGSGSATRRPACGTASTRWSGPRRTCGCWPVRWPTARGSTASTARSGRPRPGPGWRPSSRSFPPRCGPTASCSRPSRCRPSMPRSRPSRSPRRSKTTSRRPSGSRTSSPTCSPPTRPDRPEGWQLRGEILAHVDRLRSELAPSHLPDPAQRQGAAAGPAAEGAARAAGPAPERTAPQRVAPGSGRGGCARGHVAVGACAGDPAADSSATGPRRRPNRNAMRVRARRTASRARARRTR